MNQLVIIGIGNLLMKDDGIGVLIVEDLIKQDLNDHIKYIIAETDIDYCLSQLEEEDYLVIIDAVALGKVAGEVTIINLNEISYYQQLLFSHDFHLFNLIRLYQIKGILIGIEPSEINYNYGLSNKLNDQFPNILSEIQNIISIIEKKYKIL